MNDNARKWTMTAILTAILGSGLLGCNDSTFTPDDITSLAPGEITSGSSGPTSGSSGPEELHACFTMEPNVSQISEGESVTLDAGCSEQVTAEASYRWDLGDGRTSSGPRVQVQYPEPGDYVIRLVVEDRGVRSQAEKDLRVTADGALSGSLASCFEWRRLQVTESTPPCSVAFDASCSGGDIVEYRWFFSGGPPVPGGFPDAHRTTTSPRIDYSWGTDMECMYFRPFERLVQLTVVDANGGTASFEELVVFETQFQRRPN
ncbi:MAG: PKD domain-containing protein [Vicinamibacteria bacterium]